MKLPVNKNIRRMQEYSPPIENRRFFNGLLLDFNEALIPISPKVQKALVDFAKLNQFHMYPEYGDLAKKISSYADCQENQILVTNGSDQGIDIIFRTFTSKYDEVIIPYPSFSMFCQYAELNQNKIITPPFSNAGDFPLDEVLNHINKNTKLVVICNPNNPTGTSVSTDAIESILQQSSKFGAMVYIDEAYYEFSQSTSIKLLKKYSNLVITRTFSKAFGLASLRIGYAIARKELINEMKKVRGPYDLNMVAKVAAISALEDYENMKKYRDEVMEKSKPVLESFLLKNGVCFFKSDANFILFKIPNKADAFKKLEKNGFLLRPREFNEEVFLRVTIGTLEQTKKFISVLKKIISTS